MPSGAFVVVLSGRLLSLDLSVIDLPVASHMTTRREEGHAATVETMGYLSQLQLLDDVEAMVDVTPDFPASPRFQPTAVAAVGGSVVGRTSPSPAPDGRGGGRAGWLIDWTEGLTGPPRDPTAAVRYLDACRRRRGNWGPEACAASEEAVIKGAAADAAMAGAPRSAVPTRLRLAVATRRVMAIVRVLLHFAFEHAQPWAAVALLGLLAGVLAAVTEVVTHWLADLKRGVCVELYWANEYLCCAAPTMESPSLSIADGGNAAMSLGGVPAVASWDGGGPLVTACAAFTSWSRLLGSSGGSSNGEGISFVLYVTLSVAFAALSTFLCLEYAPQATGSGIVEVKTILSGVRIPGFLSFRLLVVKATGLCLAVGSGLTLGKEGPFVHLGAAIASSMGTTLFPAYRRSEVAQRELISTGAAVGVAVAFGAPIGGVLFSLEEVSKYFPHRVMLLTFFATTVATLVLRRIDPTHTGRLVQFAVPYRHPWQWFELSAFSALGVLGGVIGASLIAINQRVQSRRRRSPWLKAHPIMECVALAAATAMLCFPHVFLRRSMTDTLASLFEDCAGDSSTGTCYHDEGFVTWQLLYAAAVRFGLMCITLGAKLPAGAFVPSLFIGACVGRCVGAAMKGLELHYHGATIFASCAESQQCIVPGVYAIVGAAAVLAGVTRMKLCLAVIVMELTGGLDYVVPCMLASLLASWTADWFGVRSLYEYQAAEKQLPLVSDQLTHLFDTASRQAESTRDWGRKVNRSQRRSRSGPRSAIDDRTDVQDWDTPAAGLASCPVVAILHWRTENTAAGLRGVTMRPSSPDGGGGGMIGGPLSLANAVYHGMSLDSVTAWLVGNSSLHGGTNIPVLYPRTAGKTPRTPTFIGTVKRADLVSRIRILAAQRHPGQSAVCFTSAVDDEGSLDEPSSPSLSSSARSAAHSAAAAAAGRAVGGGEAVVRMADLVNGCEVRVRASMTVAQLHRVFTSLGVDHVVILEDASTLMGVVTQEELISFVQSRSSATIVAGSGGGAGRRRSAAQRTRWDGGRGFLLSVLVSAMQTVKTPLSRNPPQASDAPS